MPLFAETGLPTLFFLMAMMVTIGLLLMRSQRYFSRPNRGQGTSVQAPRSRSETPSGRFGPPPEMISWEVSMHDTARDLSAQLDSKMAALEHLIRDADRAAARLEASLDKARGRATEDRPAQLPPASQAESLRLAGRTGTNSPRDDEPGALHRSADVRYQEIYTLADYGYPASEIAQRMGSPVGEVELILSLRERQ